MVERRWEGPFGQRSSPTNGKKRTYLIILNTPIKINQEAEPNQVFEELWKRSEYRICADGGANRLYDYCSTIKLKADEKNGVESRVWMLVPDYVKGDLDSIRPDVREFYENSQSQIILDQDQDSTDFGKCLRLIEGVDKQCESNGDQSNSSLLIHGGLTGRLDQTIHTLHTLLLRLGPPSASSIISRRLFRNLGSGHGCWEHGLCPRTERQTSPTHPIKLETRTESINMWNSADRSQPRYGDHERAQVESRSNENLDDRTPIDFQPHPTCD
ncbi:hypothetical protein H4Q26_005557 [Puccinia striiformis f. sp. tritici PST-130]|nr:hypothetical protein H4Q26_005557 [Puccinia striiformis f. sp. tritici PST-130]